MVDIKTKPLKDKAVIKVPGSKSYTHRALIAAALSDGPCRVSNALRSEDTLLTLGALRQMGVRVDDNDEAFLIHGRHGRLAACAEPIYLANAGTSMRLLAALVVLGQGSYTLTGSARMCQRPIQPLLDSLCEMGVDARASNGNGCPPVVIQWGTCRGGRTRIDCGVSSQYLSALLLIAPCLSQGLVIEVTQGPVSRPYIDMTTDIMQSFGVGLDRLGYDYFDIPGNQIYQCGDHTVEPDASQAGYFWAAAAITGNCVQVRGVTRTSRQGDAGLAEVFRQMGCRVDHDPEGIAVIGADLHAVTVDMGHMPDMVPTLAVVAAFARGTTVIRNVAHLRAKECDRLAAVSQELSKMGIQTCQSENELQITGGQPHGADIETYNDHRIAMSFAVAGLKAPGVVIKDETCVKKSFPDFWQVFDGLYA
jgi:3-phosphoshikimate 1-carboxyvinyltransferase